MRVGVRRQQTLLVTTELALWGCENAFLFTNRPEVDFGITLVFSKTRCQGKNTGVRCLRNGR